MLNKKLSPFRDFSTAEAGDRTMKESTPYWADFLSSYGDNREYGQLIRLSSNTHPLPGDVKSLL
jgi:hypothetical protein